MIQEEQHRFAAQGNKAINIFAATLGKNQRCKPELNLGIDEASACHLTYIWSELRMLGQDPRLWFTTMRQDRGKKKPKLEDMPDVTAARPATARRAVPRPGVPRPGAAVRGKQEAETFGDEANEIRIACIDIGGGTTDLMIAKYNFESKIDDYVRGQVLHQDGISLGGDQLVKRLLETIIVPAFADSLGLEEEDVQLLFGPEVPRNRELRAQRVNWMNRLFVPLAQAYLENAGRRPCRADHPHRSWTGRSRRRRVAATGVRQAARSRLLQRPAGVEPGLSTSWSSRAWSTTLSPTCSTTSATASSSTRPTW